MRPEQEPVVFLPRVGEIVLRATFDTLMYAWRTGHRVHVDDDGLVSITPDDLPADSEFLLCVTPSETAAVIREFRVTKSRVH